MKGYTEIQSQEDWDQLTQRMHGFHDAILKEVHFSQRAHYVDRASSIWNFHLDGHFLIQGNEIVEFFVSGIDSISTLAHADLRPIEASFQPAQRSTPAAISIDLGGLKIRTERLFYCDRADWLGQKVRLRHEVPSIEAIQASAIDDEWRQCSHCRDAWQEAPDAQFSICPNCGKMTELYETP